MTHVYWPLALSWMFSLAATSVGFAVVGAWSAKSRLRRQASATSSSRRGVFDVAGGSPACSSRVS